jgi:lipoprotein-anchoring transpeptidase ErfK/SrfK
MASEIERKFLLSSTPKAQSIRISIGQQRLWLLAENDQVLHEYAISTATNGAGEVIGSYCTPRGRHRIRAMIGADSPPGAVFIARRPTGEVYNLALAKDGVDRDWILTRILWLAGLEPGRNRYGQVDTQRRYIYIHGTPDSVPMGQPGSRGCVRMRNADIVELFDYCYPDMPVEITET